MLFNFGYILFLVGLFLGDFANLERKINRKPGNYGSLPKLKLWIRYIF